MLVLQKVPHEVIEVADTKTGEVILRIDSLEDTKYKLAFDASERYSIVRKKKGQNRHA